jgi:hypothetical protein
MPFVRFRHPVGSGPIDVRRIGVDGHGIMYQ